MPQLAVVRMKLRVPEERVFQPLFLRKSEQRLDVRADVNFVVTFAEDGHERNGGNLFDEGAVAELRGSELRLAVEAPCGCVIELPRR
jgi:hypothetical protein